MSSVGFSESRHGLTDVNPTKRQRIARVAYGVPGNPNGPARDAHPGVMVLNWGRSDTPSISFLLLGTKVDTGRRLNWPSPARGNNRSGRRREEDSIGPVCGGKLAPAGGRFKPEAGGGNGARGIGHAGRRLSVPFGSGASPLRPTRRRTGRVPIRKSE